MKAGGGNCGLGFICFSSKGEVSYVLILCLRWDGDLLLQLAEVAVEVVKLSGGSNWRVKGLIVSMMSWYHNLLDSCAGCTHGYAPINLEEEVLS